MIERIVLLKSREEFATEQAIAELVERSRDVLPRLPGVVECSVGLAADEKSGDQWHISLVVRFSSLDDLPTFADHPDHRSYVDDFIRPRLASIAGYNFEV
jgi:antibiotic biosynthesis monooxygenase (ABM) superfamily enzyme